MSAEKDEATLSVSLSVLTDLIGSSNYSIEVPGSEMLGLACNVIDSAADELDALRQALSDDELDAENFELVLWRIARRMRTGATLAWLNDPGVIACRRAADARREALGGTP